MPYPFSLMTRSTSERSLTPNNRTKSRRTVLCQPSAERLETRELLSTFDWSDLETKQRRRINNPQVLVEEASPPVIALSSVSSSAPVIYPTTSSTTPWVNVTDTSTAGLYDGGNVIVIDKQGRAISIGGEADATAGTPYPGSSFKVVRYGADATLDASYNGTGVKVVANTGSDFTGTIQPADQKIVAAGRNNQGYLTLARLNPDGSNDSSFGNQGVVTVTTIGVPNTTPGAPGAANARGIAIDGQSRILVAGDPAQWSPSAGVFSRDFMVARFTSNGALDKTFNRKGYATLDFQGHHDYASSVVAQPDGKIVAGGFSYTSGSGATFGHYSSVLARYNANGTLDSSFGSGGVVIANLPGSADDSINNLALDGSGKIVAAASFATTPGGSHQPMVVRYNSNGTLDTTFNGTGSAVIPTPSMPVSYGGVSIALYKAADGSQKIVEGLGAGSSNASADFGLAQLNADGTLDTSFGGTGVVFQDLNAGQGDQLRSIAIAQLVDGPRIYATGNAQRASVDTITARFRVDGSLDSV